MWVSWPDQCEGQRRAQNLLCVHRFQQTAGHRSELRLKPLPLTASYTDSGPYMWSLCFHLRMFYYYWICFFRACLKNCTFFLTLTCWSLFWQHLENFNSQTYSSIYIHASHTHTSWTLQSSYRKQTTELGEGKYLFSVLLSDFLSTAVIVALILLDLDWFGMTEPVGRFWPHTRSHLRLAGRGNTWPTQTPHHRWADSRISSVI